MWECNNCGIHNDDELTFCKKCNTKIHYQQMNKTQKLEYDIKLERTNVACVHAVGLIPWIIISAFSIMAIEHASILMRLYLYFLWWYPVISIVMYFISSPFYNLRKFLIARIIIWSPLFIPISLMLIMYATE